MDLPDAAFPPGVRVWIHSNELAPSSGAALQYQEYVVREGTVQSVSASRKYTVGFDGGDSDTLDESKLAWAENTPVFFLDDSFDSVEEQRGKVLTSMLYTNNTGLVEVLYSIAIGGDGSRLVVKHGVRPEQLKLNLEDVPSNAVEQGNVEQCDSPVMSHEEPDNAAETSCSGPGSPSERKPRVPDGTLFIRNIPEQTTKSDVLSLFGPHGEIIGISLNTNRKFCFVDFDDAAPVSAILAEAERSLVKDPRTLRKIENSFMLHGRVLEMEKKAPPKSKNSKGNEGQKLKSAGRYRGARAGRAVRSYR